MNPNTANGQNLHLQQTRDQSDSNNNIPFQENISWPQQNNTNNTSPNSQNNCVAENQSDSEESTLCPDSDESTLRLQQNNTNNTSPNSQNNCVAENQSDSEENAICKNKIADRENSPNNESLIEHEEIPINDERNFAEYDEVPTDDEESPIEYEESLTDDGESPIEYEESLTDDGEAFPNDEEIFLNRQDHLAFIKYKQIQKENISHKNKNSKIAMLTLFDLINQKNTNAAIPKAKIINKGKLHSSLALFVYEIAEDMKKPNAMRWYFNTNKQDFDHISFRDHELKSYYSKRLSHENQKIPDDLKMLWINHHAQAKGSLTMALFGKVQNTRTSSNSPIMTKYNDFIIIALYSGREDAFEIKLTQKSEAMFATHCSFFARKFLDIFALWAGESTIAHVSDPISDLKNSTDICKCSYDFLQETLSDQEMTRIINMDPFAISNQSLFKKLGTVLFGGDNKPVLNIYASGIHPLFINYWIEHTIKKKIPLTSTLSRSSTLNKISCTLPLPLRQTHHGLVNPFNTNHIINDKNTLTHFVLSLGDTHLRIVDHRQQQPIYYEIEKTRSFDSPFNQIQYNQVPLSRKTISFFYVHQQASFQAYLQKNFAQYPAWQNELSNLILNTICEHMRGIFGFAIPEIYRAKAHLIAKMLTNLHANLVKSSNAVYLFIFATIWREIHERFKGSREFVRAQSFLYTYFSEKMCFFDKNLFLLAHNALDEYGYAHVFQCKIGSYVPDASFLIATTPQNTPFSAQKQIAWPAISYIVNLDKKFSTFDSFLSCYLGIRFAKTEDDLLVTHTTYETPFEIDVISAHRIDMSIHKNFFIDNTCMPRYKKKFFQLIEQLEDIANPRFPILIHSTFGVDQVCLVVMCIIMHRLCRNLKIAFRKEGIRISQKEFLKEVYSHLFTLKLTRSPSIFHYEEQILALYEMINTYWAKLEDFYSMQNLTQTRKQKMPLLNFPTPNTNLPLKVIKEMSYNLTHCNFDCQSFCSITSFTPNWFLFTHIDNAHKIQQTHLPLYYHLVELYKPLTTLPRCFLVGQVLFFHLAFLFKKTNNKDDIGSVYYPLLARFQNDRYHHLFHSLMDILCTLAFKIKETKIDLNLCYNNSRNKYCNMTSIINPRINENDFKILFSRYLEDHSLNFIQQITDHNLSIYLLSENHFGLPEFRNSTNNKNTYIASFAQAEDVYRQVVFLHKNRPLHQNLRQNNVMHNTSPMQINAERTSNQYKIVSIYLRSNRQQSNNKKTHSPNNKSLLRKLPRRLSPIMEKE